MRTQGTGHSCRRTGVLCGVRRHAPRWQRQAPRRMAIRPRHPARNPAASVGLGDLQPSEVLEPDGHRSTRRRLRPFQRRPGAADLSGRTEELRERRVRFLQGRGAGESRLAWWRRLHGSRDCQSEAHVRGTASYTIPKADVLVSTVFQWRPGLERTALWDVPKEQVTWEAPSASRAALACTGLQAGQVGCFSPGLNITATNYRVNLLAPGDLYSPGSWIADLKLGKNIRFSGKRLNVGVDVYNLFNNDVVRDYQNTFPVSGTGVPWGTPTVLLSPRFARLQLQFDF